MIKQTKTVRKNGSSSQSTPLQPSLLHQDHIDEDDQLRVENNRPFEMHPDPQINANALTWAQNGNKARTETIDDGKGSNLVRGVEHRGLEPLTYCLQSSRATNCANAPWTSIV